MRLGNNHGSALVTSLVISVLIISAITIYSLYGRVRSRENVSTFGRQTSLNYADAGLNDALAWLRLPGAARDLPPPANVTSISSTTLMTSQTNGRSETSLYRSNVDRNYITADATGYYYLQNGASVDPLNNRKAQVSSVHATILFTSVSEFIAAVTNTLEIANGSNLGTGNVYASDLIFGGAATLGTAYYYNSITCNGGAQCPPSGVTAVKLPTQLNVANIDPTIRQLYQNRMPNLTLDPLPIVNAGPNQSVHFTGTLGPQNTVPDTHVFFVDETQAPNGVHIGQAGQPFTVDGVYTIFSSTDVYIHSSILLSGNSWLALVSEGTIHLATDAPDTLTLYGNFVANGSVMADYVVRPNPGPACSLSITGGIVGQSNPNFSQVWGAGCTRTYAFPNAATYPGSVSRDLYLPNLSMLLDYSITRGRPVPLEQQSSSAPLVNN